jgi:ligand-binding sensor domain-containing protein/serine phosphatase RsbU (regulator of sigma subunit)
MIRSASLFICLLCVNFVIAQQLRFKHITSEEGLSTNLIKTIIQDKQGFIWIGTQDGLNKYDGYQAKIYKNDPTDPLSLSNSEITCLLQVRSSLILVGTRYGFNFFDPTIEKFSLPVNAGKQFELKITAMCLADSNHVLIGSEDGLFMLDLNERKIVSSYYCQGLKLNVKAISKEGSDIFIGTLGNGLWRMQGLEEPVKVQFTKPDYLKLKNEATESITHIGHYAGKMYLGTNGHGILKVDRSFEVQANITFREQNENSDVIRDFVIRNNHIYAATAYGVLVYNLISERVHIYIRHDKPFSLNANPCNCITVDNQNNFWIGTDLGGINVSYIRSQKFPVSTYSYETEIPGVYSFYETGPRMLMIGGIATLRELNLETGQSENHGLFLGSATVRAIAKQDSDIYWIGTAGKGIVRYDKRRKQWKIIPSSKVGNVIQCLMLRDDFLFAGTAGEGLTRLNLKTLEIQRFTDRNGLPDVTINTIFCDSRNSVWVGTNDGGLVHLRNIDGQGKLIIDKIYQYKGKSGEICSNQVFAINQDASGNIWAATSTGLSKLMPNGSFFNFYQKDGMANTYLNSLQKDTTGNFWMSCNGGLIRFDPMKQEKEIIFKNYGSKDGLLNSEYNLGAAFSGTSGYMYFGGEKGFNAFRPTTITDNLHVPRAYITGYRRAGKDVELDSLITYKKLLQLGWKENSFQFEVAALDYTDPGKNKFRYKLEGYDADWSTPTNVRYISYTELPGGKYVFKVKAANNDGIWNEEPALIYINVIPPFWKTNTFYFLVLLLCLSGIYAFSYFRVKKVLRQNRLLEQKVAERTKELEEKNQDILSSIQYARRIQEAILPSKNHIFRKIKKIFILYRPKDIVSGDFYWFAEKNGIKIFAVVDCTGHGVPGAFMSMIGHNLLHQVVLEKGITDPGEILTHLHKGVQEALRQGHNEINTNDGMDVSLITINDPVKEVKWAGANRPLVMINEDGGFSRYDGNKFPVGGAQSDSERIFDSHLIPMQMPAMAYMFTDGYADQFGGERGKKFMVKRFHQLLMQIHLKSADDQRKELELSFDAWRHNHEQVDDVLIVGIEI